MRISDWSSTCALPISAAGGTAKLRQLVPVPPHPQQDGQGRRFGSVWTAGRELSRRFRHHLEPGRQRQHGGRYAGVPYPCWYWWWPVHGGQPPRFLLPATRSGWERKVVVWGKRV